VCCSALSSLLLCVVYPLTFCVPLTFSSERTSYIYIYISYYRVNATHGNTYLSQRTTKPTHN
jgi:hypothetical protein